MKTETADYLDKAHTCLADARQTADCGIGPAVASIIAEQAATAITTACRFIDAITPLLPPGLTSSLGPSAQAQGSGAFT